MRPSMLSSESPESPESPVLASTHSLPLELPGVAQIYVNKPCVQVGFHQITDVIIKQTKPR